MVYFLVRRGVLLAAAAMVLGAQAAEFYVAPDGSDAQAGTQAKPFATLMQARQAARQAAGGPHRIVVRGGNYFNVWAALGSEDSGLVLEAAPGEKPVLHGGQRITGWQRDGDHAWAAALPEFPRLPGAGADQPERWAIRMLQLNGQWRPRARFPATGELKHQSTFDVPWMSTTGGGWKRKPTGEELTTLNYQPGDLPASLEIKNAEITVFHMWDESCVGVASQDAANHLLKLAPEPGHPPGAFGVQKYVVHNTREGLTGPGRWYHDRANNRLVYWPLPGEDMARAEVIAPTVFTLLRIAGERERPARDITVRGLEFRVTTTPLRTAGFAASALDGAISLGNTEDCLLDGVRIACVAGHGLNSRRGQVRPRVQDCEITSCGAGGIYVGGNGRVISNNLVRTVGLNYPSAVGIHGGGRDDVISHNEISDCTYSAISCGGNNTRFEFNDISDCMKVLHDGAAIYVFAATNTILRGNLAHDFKDFGGYGASAYYLDERSVNSVVESNLSLRVGWPSHNHMATNNVIRDNVFIVDGDAKLTFPRSTGYRVERNVLYATGKIRIEGANAVDVWSGNIFYSRTGRIEALQLKQYSGAGTTTNAPGDTLVSDPLFRNWQQGDFSYQAGSPALKLGLQALDASHAGRLKRGR